MWRTVHFINFMCARINVHEELVGLSGRECVMAIRDDAESLLRLCIGIKGAPWSMVLWTKVFARRCVTPNIVGFTGI